MQLLILSLIENPQDPNYPHQQKSRISRESLHRAARASEEQAAEGQGAGATAH